MRLRSLVPVTAILLFVAPLYAVSAPPPSPFLGPGNPPLVDTNGDGRPDAGDQTINFVYLRAGIEIISPYDTNTLDGDNFFALSNLGTNGKYLDVGRTADNGDFQEIDITGFNGAGKPINFSFFETSGLTLRKGNHTTALHSGQGTLLDSNGDGSYDTLQGTGDGGSINFSLGLTYFDTNGDGKPDYVSLPWAQTVGVQPGSPQTFTPISDSNGDGTKDSLVLDLNDDGVADPEFYASPILFVIPAVVPVAAQIPTLSQWAMILLSLALCAAGIVTLRGGGFTLSI
jgi:hypothetical protein